LQLWFPESEHGGTPWDQRENYERWNPANHVNAWNTPMLVIHGAQDFRLTDSEGLSAFNALQRRGVPSRFLHFQSENHWVLNPRNAKVWHEETLGWMRKWTSPKSSSKEKSAKSGLAFQE
jgi:dipeptidyl aminopeptidase/acylaminoacyl peptidase